MLDIAAVRDRLTLQNKAEINAALTSALAGALPRLEAILQTHFTAGTSTDYFYVGPHCIKSDGMYQLRLRNGFIRPTPAPVLSKSLTMSSFEAVLNATTLLDTDLGIFTVPGDLEGSYVSVAYSYGFSGPTEVPAWLQEVMLSYTIKVLSMGTVNDKKDELSPIFEFIDLHSADILNSHLRTGSFLVRAMR